MGFLNVATLALLIPIVAVVAWGAHGVVEEIYKGRAKVAEAGHGDVKRALDEAASTNRQVLAKLDGLEMRLANVEKTLNDIPT
jgi:hypothetical protein